METLLSSDESYDMGRLQSPGSVDPNDHSASVTPVHSTMSTDSSVFPRTCSQTSGFSDHIDESNSFCSEPSPSDWPVLSKSKSQSSGASCGSDMKLQKLLLDENLAPQGIAEPDLEMMKERFAKLLLGEDMSGSGKGVCTAVTISNAITNLYATVFGQNLRLEPLDPEKKALWKREMNCLLSVCDYIVEFIPRSQSLSNGATIEVMESRARSDIYINLPALRKLDSMLMETLDSFQNTEFWYAEEGSLSMNSTRSATGSFRKVVVQRKEEKWWLPVPLVPSEGLSEKARKHLKNKRESTNQIHKAAMAINSSILNEMDIPESYMVSLPKSGRASIGDSIYKYISSSEQFFPLLDCLNIASEHEALQLADRVEASMYTWRRKACLRNSKSSWNMVKDLMSNTNRADKNYVLAERAESLLFCLKQRFPEMAQTSLDICKIQYNKDVGKSILESYSRALESLAYNILSRIDDLLYVDNLTKQSDGKQSPIPTVSIIAHKHVTIPYFVPSSDTPYKTTFSTPSFSPMRAPLVSPLRGETTPSLSSKNNEKPQRRGFGVRRVLTNYLGVESKPKICANPAENPYSVTHNNGRERSKPQTHSSVHQSCTKPNIY